jgi:hypothetical protein
MVESRTPVEQQQRGPFPHDCPVDNQSRSLDIEPEVDVTNSDSHQQTLQSAITGYRDRTWNGSEIFVTGGLTERKG